MIGEMNLPLLALTVLLSGGIREAAAQTFWLEGWTYRRALKVVWTRDNFPVPPVAVVNFCGPASLEGTDIRIVDAGGQVVPHWVVSVNSGNVYQVAFSPQGENYFLYYGNPQASQSDTSFQPQRGLLLEVYPRQGWECHTWEKAREVIEKSRQSGLLARSFHPRIWDGSNPLGLEKDVVRIYTGYFYSQQPETLVFATSSAGASFVMVDDRLVAAWPGWHGPVPFVRPEQSGAIDLKPGLHRLTYYHIGRPGQEMAVAAVARAQEKHFQVIPEKFFLPLARVETGPVEKINSSLAADFSWENTHYLYREQWDLITFRFQESSCSTAKIVSREWEFGDGQKGAGETVIHTYLQSGLYPVTLKVRDVNGKTDSVTMKVKVQPDPLKLNLPGRPPAEYLEEFQSYDLAGCSLKDLRRLAGIFISYDARELALKVYQEMLRRNLSVEEKDQTSLVAARLASAGKDYLRAENLYREMLGQNWRPEICLELGQVLFLRGDLAAATEQYQKIVKMGEKVPAALKRRAQLYLADILREKGDFSAARKEYERLTETKLFEMRSGYHARNVLDALKNRDASTALERLNAWAEELPAVKLRGHWSVLFARANLLRRDYQSAWHELDLFLRGCQEKDNPYLVWALSLAAEAQEGLGNRVRAEEYYRRIIKEYPHHQLASVAADRLKSP